MLAERVYCPWVDFEAKMRENAIPLFGLESAHPIADFDIFAFSLPYEQLYTNVLTMLDLAGVPLRTADRSAEHPVVIAGGSGCFNPEPMSAFFDAMVIGEGEEVVFELIDAVEEWKKGINRLGNWVIDSPLESPNTQYPPRSVGETRRHPRRLCPSALRASLRCGWHAAGNPAYPSRRARRSDEAGGDCAAPAGDALYRA